MEYFNQTQYGVFQGFRVESVGMNSLVFGLGIMRSLMWGLGATNDGNFKVEKLYVL